MGVNQGRFFFMKIIMLAAIAVLFVSISISFGGTGKAVAASSDIGDLINNAQNGDTVNVTVPQQGIAEDYGDKLAINKSITLQGNLPGSNESVPINWIPIKVNADNVTIENFHFANGAQTYGGLLCARNVDTLVIRNCTFDSAYGFMGGLVFLKNCQNVVFENCTFTNGENNYKGAGLYLKNVDGCEFINCEFSDNSAIEGGGAGHLYNCDNISFSDCIFSNNTSEPDIEYDDQFFYGVGAALTLKKTSAEFEGCDFFGNVSHQGGALLISGGEVNIQGCEFSNNRVSWVRHSDVDGIRNVVEIILMAAKFDVQGIIEKIVTMATTKATCPDAVVFPWEGHGTLGGEGGAIYVYNAELNIIETQFTDNFGQKEGGAVYLLGNKGNTKTVNIAASTFINNSSQKGGAIMNLASGAVIENNCLFRDNEAEAIGGALYSTDSITVDETSFISNEAAMGGAVCASAVNNLQIYSNCDFDSNSAGDKNGNGEGGAIYAHGADEDSDGDDISISDCQIKINNCEFIQNAAQNGGAVTFNYITSMVINSDFNQNYALSYGGALYNTKLADTTVKKCEFTDNSADASGGANFNYQAYLHVSRSKYIDNEGGATSDFDGTMSFNSTLFTGNWASSPGSVLLLNSTNLCQVTNCTIAVNCTFNDDYTINGTTPIFAREYSRLIMRNNIVVSNSEAERVSPLDILWTENSSVEATYNICALEGEGNFEESIDIFRVPYEDFRLCYDFLWDEMGAMDKGDNAAINQNRDLAGNKRIVDNDGDGAAEVDLGAYEQEYIEVTFNNAHPQAGVEYGSVSGDNTEQWILRGSMADVSNIEVTPVDGWEFDYWETLDHTRVDSADPFYSSTNLYGVYKQKQVQVSYEYDPNKLQIAAADSGLFETIDQDTAWFITHTNQYASPNKPRVGGKNGWVFAGWTPDPESVSEDTVMTADVGPTAIYYFGTGGYYDDGSKTALWTTDMCNPLYSPNDANIVTPRRFEFVGWSETAGGEAITLPSSITQPERFYAVYEKKQVTLTVDLDGKGTFTADPSGDYDYGTKLDLNNSEIMDISPDSGLYCIGFTDEEGKNIHLPYLTLKEDVTITAQYAAVPSGNLIIENSIVDGFINTRLALNMGFIDVNSTQAVKPNPDGSEDLLSLIIPQSHTGFAGFEAEENGNDLTLTALYTNPYYRLMLKFFR